VAADVAANVSRLSLHVEECVPVGEHFVLATFRLAGEGAESGVGVESPVVFQLGEMRRRAATATSYGLRDPFDPENAIDAQAHLTSDLLRRFRSIPLALAATTPARARSRGVPLRARVPGDPRLRAAHPGTAGRRGAAPGASARGAGCWIEPESRGRVRRLLEAWCDPDLLAADQGHEDVSVADLFLRDLGDVLVEDDQVGELALPSASR
jgi:hypothetical protein